MVMPIMMIEWSFKVPPHVSRESQTQHVIWITTTWGRTNHADYDDE